MNYEIIWLGHDNLNDLILKADGVAVDLSGVTEMKIKVEDDDLIIVSGNYPGDPILWNGEEFETGEIRLSLGGQALSTARHKATLVVYDAANPNGISWGHLWLEVRPGIPAEESA